MALAQTTPEEIFMNRALTLPVAAAMCVAGCSAYSSFDKASSDTAFGFDDATTGYGTGTGSGSSTGTGTGSPEDETSFFALSPAQTDNAVFVVNPSRDTLTRIRVDTLEVETTDVGVNPQIVLTSADDAKAVVLNADEDTVSVVDTGTLDVATVQIRDNLNRMKLSPDGAFAVLWYDFSAAEPGDGFSDGVQSFNEASFVHLGTLEHTPMAVGFSPRDVVFTPDGTTAVVVSNETLAVVDLEAAVLSPALIPLSDAIEPPEAEEVLLSVDGQVALVRQFGSDALVVVDLIAQTTAELPVGLNPTDMDRTPDGTQAAVVCRGSEDIWMVDLTDPLGVTPTTVALPTGYSFGAVELDPTGQRGVVYTTATLQDRYGLWDRGTDTITVKALEKPVEALGISPDGESMLVVHTLLDGPNIQIGSPFSGEWSLTAINLVDGRTNPMLLPSEPISFVNSGDGRHAYFIMEGEQFLEQLDYITLLPQQIPLKSNPKFLGVLATPEGSADAPFAWVSQEHELGRISFFNPNDNTLETITGFELNSEIEE